MNRYRETSGGDWLKTLAAVIVFFVYLGLMTGVLVWTGYLWLYILSVGLGLIVLANWHARTFAYRCAKCGHEFEISTLMNLVSPHGPAPRGGWKLLKCPECRRWSKARIIGAKLT